MICKVCGSESKEFFSHLLLNKYDVRYYCCDKCEFLQTEDPFWLSESYQETINLSDTGYVTRNVYLSKKTFLLFYFLFGKKYSYLDFGGGYGMLTRLMRDYGLDYFWSDQYTKNLFAKGFEHKEQKIKAISCFECLEHFVDPVAEIEKMLKISTNIFFTTRVKPQKVPGNDWGYYAFDHGQHISFYSHSTLQYLAKKFDLKYYSYGDNLHFFTNSKFGYLFKIVMLLSKFQIDILVKKLLKSRTTDDSIWMKNLSTTKK